MARTSRCRTARQNESNPATEGLQGEDFSGKLDSDAALKAQLELAQAAAAASNGTQEWHSTLRRRKNFGE